MSATGNCSCCGGTGGLVVISLGLEKCGSEMFLSRALQCISCEYQTEIVCATGAVKDVSHKELKKVSSAPHNTCRVCAKSVWRWMGINFEGSLAKIRLDCLPCSQKSQWSGGIQRLTIRGMSLPQLHPLGRGATSSSGLVLP